MRKYEAWILGFFRSKNSSMELAWFAPQLLKFNQLTPFYLKVKSLRQEQNWNKAKSQRGYFDQFPSWCLVLDQEQIYRPNMSTMEHHFHGKTAVHILLEEDAHCVCAWLVPSWHKSPKIQIGRGWTFEIVTQTTLYLRKYKYLVKEVHQWNTVFCLCVWEVAFNFWFSKSFTCF